MVYEFDVDARQLLTAELSDNPYTVIARHQLQHGLCDVYANGSSPTEQGIVLQSHLDPQELIGFGADAQRIWEIMQSLTDWFCIEVETACAYNLGPIIQAATGQPVRYLDDLYYHLVQPAIIHMHPAVRLLTVADAALVAAASPSVQGGGYASFAEMLAEGVVAGAVIGEQLVAIANTSAITESYADVGVGTLLQWRQQGLATAAASLVAQTLQQRNRIPVWSTGATNIASQRVAAHLGFTMLGKRTYVIVPHRAPAGSPYAIGEVSAS